VKILEIDGLKFKSFDGSDTLLPYEDWRLSAEERADDLVNRLSIEEMAGLMLHSDANRVPDTRRTYDGKEYDKNVNDPAQINDTTLDYIGPNNVRCLLMAIIESPETAMRWVNKLQAMVEGKTHGIPCAISSDPRHSAYFDSEFAPGASGSMSQWSNMLGLASTMDPDMVRRFGAIASAEYRAMGISTALSPQCDIGTDPRWYRYASTFGCDPQLAADITRAYADGFQSTDGADGGWGSGSVNAMAKHWPGGGSGEGGRDAHYGKGKFAVYPGDCYEDHKIAFTQGAFNLDGATHSVSAVMPYYTVSWGQDRDGLNVGNSYSHDIITRQLRDEARFDGVVCTDWLITHDEIHPSIHSGKPWGVESLTSAERHYKALLAGVDQFGGNGDIRPVLDAYKIGLKEYGEEYINKRFKQSARRILLNFFRVGLFENPYVDIEKSKKIIGNSDFMTESYAQQLKSIIMLKNHNKTLPLKPRAKVWIPTRSLPEMKNYWGMTIPATSYQPVKDDVFDRYFERAGSPADADAAIVFIESPKSRGMGYDKEDARNGGNGYIPITLQYRPYRATAAREHSIAGGDVYEDFTDRSYKDKCAYCDNECDLDMVLQTRRLMGDKPVIVVLMASHPSVVSEYEPAVDAIVMGFDVQSSAYLDIISGKAQPQGLLPFEMPASMEAIERHCEDKPHDITPHVDADGNNYRFAFGLDFLGVISDSRTRRYSPR
jgi:beta-glucosidase